MQEQSSQKTSEKPAPALQNDNVASPEIKKEDSKSKSGLKEKSMDFGDKKLNKPDFVLDGMRVNSKLVSYNGLIDRHLVTYFSNEKLRNHLLKMGLITDAGQIIEGKKKKIRRVLAVEAQAEKNGTRSMKHKNALENEYIDKLPKLGKSQKEPKNLMLPKIYLTNLKLEIKTVRDTGKLPEIKKPKDQSFSPNNNNAGSNLDIYKKKAMHNHTKPESLSKEDLSKVFMKYRAKLALHDEKSELKSDENLFPREKPKEKPLEETKTKENSSNNEKTQEVEKEKHIQNKKSNEILEKEPPKEIVQAPAKKVSIDKSSQLPRKDSNMEKGPIVKNEKKGSQKELDIAGKNNEKIEENNQNIDIAGKNNEKIEENNQNIDIAVKNNEKIEENNQNIDIAVKNNEKIEENNQNIGNKEELKTEESPIKESVTKNESPLKPDSKVQITEGKEYEEEIFEESHGKAG